MLRKLWFNLAYIGKPIWDTGISPPELIDFLSSHENGRALELGCGTGTNAITLAKSGWQVTAVDFAFRALRSAKIKARQENIKIDFRWENVDRLRNIFGCFDLILDIGCFHSLALEVRSKYIANIDRFLSPEGTYLLYIFFKESDEIFGPGVTEETIRILSQAFELIQRKDSTERGIRPSAWIWFQKYDKTKLISLVN